MSGTEGCLSIPGYVGENIVRAERVVLKGQDIRGKNIRFEADGWFARILQHEYDHLNGVLYLDRLQHPEDLREVRIDDLDEDEEELEEIITVE